MGELLFSCHQSLRLSVLHLGGERYPVAWPDGADSGLSLQLALWVLVCDSRRNAHSTAAGALGPLSGLDRTFLVVLLQVVPHCQMDHVT